MTVGAHSQYHMDIFHYIAVRVYVWLLAVWLVTCYSELNGAVLTQFCLLFVQRPSYCTLAFLPPTPTTCYVFLLPWPHLAQG